jgi:hypothetical protein
VTPVGERRGAYRVLMERYDKMRQLGRPRLRWEEYIKTDFEDVQWGTWTRLIWPTILGMAGSCKSGSEMSGSIKCGKFLDELTAVNFSGTFPMYICS